MSGAVRFFLPHLPPAVNHIWRRKAGGGMFKPAAVKKQQAVLREYALVARPTDWVLGGDFAVELTLTGDKRGDIDGRIKICFDAWNGIFWGDDKQIRRLGVTLLREGPVGVCVEVKHL